MNKIKGFTLIEMIIVVVIIGILAGIALPRYGKTVENSRLAEAQSILGVMRNAQFRYVLNTGDYTSVIGNLDVLIDNSDYFTFSLSNASAADPPEKSNTVDDIIARATRKDYKVTGGYAQGYNIYIKESGNFSSDGNGPKIY